MLSFCNVIFYVPLCSYAVVPQCYVNPKYSLCKSYFFVFCKVCKVRLGNVMKYP